MTGLAGKQRATEADVGSQEVGDENYDCLSSNFSNIKFSPPSICLLSNGYNWSVCGMFCFLSSLLLIPVCMLLPSMNLFSHFIWFTVGHTFEIILAIIIVDTVTL